VSKLPWFVRRTLAVTLNLQPAVLAALGRSYPVRRVIPISYHFFRRQHSAFYTVLRFVSSAEGSTVDVWMGRTFFVWTTVFALFQYVDSLVAHGRRVSQRSGERMFRLHSAWVERRLHRRVRGDRVAGAQDRLP